MKNIFRILGIIHSIPAIIFVWLYLFGKSTHTFNQGITAFFMAFVGVFFVVILGKD